VSPVSPWTPDAPDTPNVVPDPPATPVTEPERAEHDTLIDAPDRAPGAAVLVKAGDPIPAELVDLPRVPVERPTVGKPRRRARATEGG
jgi:hypothetical protein